MENYSKKDCEFLRQQTRQKFDRVKVSWAEAGRWALPHRTRWLTGEMEGARNNQHIVDPTHILALRSYVAGFLEGNTSASRPWYRVAHPDPDKASSPENRLWLDLFTRRTLYYLGASNFYTAAGEFYYDFGTFNTGAYFVDELDTGLHFHNLTPGSYYCLNNQYGVAEILVREFTLNVHALVNKYGKKKNGSYDWSVFSKRVRNLYEKGMYAEKIDVVHVIKPNDSYDPNKHIALSNKPWVSLTYELAGKGTGQGYSEGQEDFGSSVADPREESIFLKVAYSKRKPFIVGRSSNSDNFEWGEKGPTTDAIGLIKSLNKKAISKDMAMEQMLRPALQGPASLKKSYITSASNSFVPLDAQSAAQGGIKPLFQINPAVATINADVNDMRSQVDKIYYADYLLYLSRNPKTRTATETNAVLNEQQLIIGPNLQSLNWTHNLPVVEFVMNYVLEEDPYLPPPPEGLVGEFLKTEFISVFAQAQKAADLPAIDRYRAMIMEVGQVNPSIFAKINLDKLADLYEDRLYLPPGLNNDQSKVDAMREKAQAEAEKAQQIEHIQGLASAARDVSAAQPAQAQLPAPGGQPA